MIDIYSTWIDDFGIDGFRIDTMKHVNDEFWQRFGPEVARRTPRQQGKREFFMFGEVVRHHRSRSRRTSRPTTDVQSVLDFPFQQAAQRLRGATRSRPTTLRDFFADDDWYTDADCNAYQLPTFLGNHDMGRIGLLPQQVANPAPSDAELLARDRLAHALMFFSRGNPVVYYGDEQGFTGDGGDQDARQDMFPSAGRHPTTTTTSSAPTRRTADDNFDPTHPLYRAIRELASGARRATRRCATARSITATSSTARASTRSRRIDRDEQHEYVVALNNTEQRADRGDPDRTRRAAVRPALRLRAARRLRRTPTGGSTSPCPPLSAVVYRAAAPLPRSRRGARDRAGRPAPLRDRAEVRADVGGDSFYEVTFQARSAAARWKPIGTDDNAPYRVFHDVAELAPGHAGPVPGGRPGQRRAHARERGPRGAVAAAGDRARGPTEGGRVRGDGRGPGGRRPRTTRLRGDASSARSTAAPGRPIGTDDLLAGLHRLRRHHGPGRRQRASRTGRCSPTRPARR